MPRSLINISGHIVAAFLSNGCRQTARRIYAHAGKELKDHDLLPHGVVHKLYRDGYGFIQVVAGKEIYFHRNSVLDGFENLEIGTEVRYEEE